MKSGYDHRATTATDTPTPTQTFPPYDYRTQFAERLFLSPESPTQTRPTQSVGHKLSAPYENRTRESPENLGMRNPPHPEG
jgi:hypothetical protein